MLTKPLDDAKIGDIYELCSIKDKKPWKSVSIIVRFGTSEDKSEDIIEFSDLMILADPGNICVPEENWTVSTKDSTIEFKYIGNKQTRPEYFL